MRLDVLIERFYAGHVDIADQYDGTFTYATSYLDRPDPTPLSTLLPLREESYGGPTVAAWLENLLPDDDYVLDQWCRDYEVRRLRPIGLLGTPIGAECAGAVQFCTPERTRDLLSANGGAFPLSDEELWEGLTTLRANPAFRFSATLGDRGRSLGGVQPKDALVAAGSGWAVPWGSRASTHILKLDRERYPHETVIEHVTLQTAGRLGLAVPATRMLHGEDFDVIVVQRYDRSGVNDPEGAQRVHQEDFCQALGLRPQRKWQSSYGGPTVAKCVAVLQQHAGDDTTGSVERFRDMLLFRWVVGDTDGHAKNFSILLSGRRRLLAPLYDSATLLPHSASADEDALDVAMWAGNPGQTWTLGRTDTVRSLRRLAADVATDAATVAERAEEIAATVPGALEVTINSLAVADQDKIARLDVAEVVRRRADRCAAVASALR